MTPTPLDHVLVFVITVLLPIHTVVFWFPKLKRATARRLGPRHQAYLESNAVLWTLSLATLGLWRFQERPWTDLGISWPAGWGFWVALTATAGVIVFLVRQRWSLIRESGDAEVQETLLDHLEAVRPLLPHTSDELVHFSLVSITAGLCEELLFRGFVLGYLAALIPYPAAIVISAALFGMAHAYQGNRGILQTGLVGLGLALLLALSGSLWLPMALHAAVDLNSGRMAYELLQHDTDGPVR